MIRSGGEARYLGTRMVIEARRIGIRFVWLYIVLGALVAISVTFPLFLIARDRQLAARGEASEATAVVA